MNDKALDSSLYERDQYSIASEFIQIGTNAFKQTNHN